MKPSISGVAPALPWAGAGPTLDGGGPVCYNLAAEGRMAGLREPSVAGRFYPEDPEALRSRVRSLMGTAERRPAKGLLAPHAGFAYSGRVAGAVYSRAAVPRDVILLAFHHRGAGAPFGLWPAGAWRTPLGDVPVAGDVGDRLKAAIPGLEDDEAGFSGEHSGEVQVPFLQESRPDVRIAPVAVNSRDPASLANFGRRLAGVVRDELVVATTDLSHCGEAFGEPPPAGSRAVEWARAQDRHVLDAVMRLDERAFWDAVHVRRVSMCGVGPTAVLIAFALAAGGSAELAAYGTSADDDPDDDRAVGYPGILIR